MNVKNIKKTLFLIVLSLSVTACGGSSTNKQDTDTPSEKNIQKNSNWHNKKITKQTGKSTATFTVKPSANNIDGVVGFSNGKVSKYSDLGIIIRFATSGYIDVRNGSKYKKSKKIKYSKNKTYSFKVEMDFTKHTYNVFVKIGNNSEVKIANNFKFRTQQSNLNSINNVAHYTQGKNSIYVNNLAFSNKDTEEENNTWNNNYTGISQEAIINFEATPSATNIDSVIGLSDEKANKYTDLAMIVRFASDGYIDARDGTKYRRINNIKYSANQTYTFRIDIDFEHHTYDIYVTPKGGKEIKIGDDFAFRLEQNNINRTNYIANYTLGNGEVTISNISFPSASAHVWNNYSIEDYEDKESYSISFYASASATNIDGVIGLSNGEAKKYSDLAMIIRFAPDGYIDARDGKKYRRINNIKYSANKTYHFIFDINSTNHTYDIYVTNEDDSNIVKIGNNFKFRLEQSKLNSVNNLASYTLGSNVVSIEHNKAFTWIPSSTSYTKFPKLDLDYLEVEYANYEEPKHKIIIRNISDENNPIILKIVDLPYDQSIGNNNYISGVGVAEDNKNFYLTYTHYRNDGSSYYKMIIGNMKNKNIINFYSTYIDDLPIYSLRSIAISPEFTLDSSKLIRYTNGWISNQYDEILYDQYSNLYNNDSEFNVPTEVIINTLSDTKVTNTQRSFFEASTVHTYYIVPQPKLFKKEVSSQGKLVVQVIDITKDKNNQQTLGKITLEESDSDYTIDILAHNTTEDELFIRLEPKGSNNAIYKVYNIADIAQPLLIESNLVNIETRETVKEN